MILETERLILRPVDPERDFEPWAQAMADQQTVRYLNGKVLSRAEAWRNMAMVVGHWSIRGYGFFSLELKETREWVGRVGPWYPEGWPGREVGWMISPRHLRRGYGREAARAALAYAFDTLGWERVIHTILPGNEASISLALSLGSNLLDEVQGLRGVTDQAVLIYGQDAGSRRL